MARSQILPGNPSQILQTNLAGDTVEWSDLVLGEEQDNKVRVIDVFPLSGFLRQDQNVNDNVLSRTPITFGSNIVFNGLDTDPEDVNSVTLTNRLLRVSGIITTI